MDFCTDCWTRFSTGRLTYKSCPIYGCCGTVMPIDDDLSIVIPMLNQKGYVTLNCCSGHVQNDVPQTYIQFMDEVYFPTIPKGFHSEVREISNGAIVTNVSRCYKDGLSEIKLQQQIWKACEALLVWAESLEDRDCDE